MKVGGGLYCLTERDIYRVLVCMRDKNETLNKAKAKGHKRQYAVDLAVRYREKHSASHMASREVKGSFAPCQIIIPS